MAQSLAEFVAALQRDVNAFEAAYRQKMAEQPEHYPEVVQSDNDGRWLEFFIHFCQTGNV